jgi:hypothetical protein
MLSEAASRVSPLVAMDQGLLPSIDHRGGEVELVAIFDMVDGIARDVLVSAARAVHRQVDHRSLPMDKIPGPAQR